jgi:hypothetical protein
MLHDRRAPRGGNVDHIVVGPPGIIVFDTKSWTGAVTSEEGRLHLNGRSAHKAIDSMRAVLDALSVETDFPVAGALVFVETDISAAPRKIDGVGIVKVDEVVDLLRRKDGDLSRSQVDRAAAMVARMFPPMGEQVITEPPPPVAHEVLDTLAPAHVASLPPEERYRFYLAARWTSPNGKVARLYLNTPAGEAYGYASLPFDGGIHLDALATEDTEPLLARLIDRTTLPENDVSNIIAQQDVPFDEVVSHSRWFGRKQTAELLLGGAAHADDRMPFGVGHVVGRTCWETLRLYVTLHVRGVLPIEVGWVDLNTGFMHAHDPHRSGLLQHTWGVMFEKVTKSKKR